MGYDKKAEIALFLKSSVPFSQLVRIQLPVNEDMQARANLDQFMMPQPLPEHFTRVKQMLGSIQRCSNVELPFTAYMQDNNLLQVLCSKVVVVKVLKYLYSKQKELGVIIKDAKKSMNREPIPVNELEAACSNAITHGLNCNGWKSIGGLHFLRQDILDDSVGNTRLVDSLQVKVEVRKPETIVMLFKAEIVKIRHPVARPARCDLLELARQQSGSSCCVLPDFRPGVIKDIRSADPAILSKLRPLWQSYGFALPDSIDLLAEISFDEDPDSPTFPFPTCCVLSPAALDVAYNRLDGIPMQSILLRIRDCLSQGFFGAFGLNGLELINANFWYPEGFPKHLNQQPNKHHIDPFQSARELAQKAAKYGLGAERTLPLGSEIDIWNMSICDIDLIHGDAMGKEMKRTNYRKPHALPGPGLGTFLQQIRADNEAAAAAAAAAKQNDILFKCSAKARSGYPQERRPAIPPFAATMAPQLGTAGQKRTVKAVAVVHSSRREAPKQAKLDFRKARVQICEAKCITSKMECRPSHMLDYKKISAVVSGNSADFPMNVQSASTRRIELTEMQASLTEVNNIKVDAVKEPVHNVAKARAPSKEIVLEVVMEKIIKSHAVGRLGTLTVPELKCYLKYVKKPVGGKKAELEERVREHLSPEA